MVRVRVRVRVRVSAGRHLLPAGISRLRRDPEAVRDGSPLYLPYTSLHLPHISQASPAFDEIQKQFATEFDYRGECANAQEVQG